MPYAEPPPALRNSVRRQIDVEGLYALAKRLKVQPYTLQRFAHGVGKTHRRTLKKIERHL